MHRASRVVPLFAAWTLYVWLTRISNVAGDDGAGVAGRVASLVVAGTFVALAAAVLHAWWAGRDRLTALVRAAVVVTVVVWAPRLVLILARDHSTAFKVVHALLAVVSVTLGALAWRATDPISRRLSQAAPDTIDAWRAGARVSRRLSQAAPDTIDAWRAGARVSRPAADPTRSRTRSR